MRFLRLHSFHSPATNLLLSRSTRIGPQKKSVYSVAPGSFTKANAIPAFWEREELKLPFEHLSKIGGKNLSALEYKLLHKKFEDLE
jgi:hypothetical protein